MAVMSGVSVRVTPSSVTIFSPGLARRNHHRRPVELGQIKRVQRLVELEQDVVRGVDDVVDGPLTDRSQAIGEPPGLGATFTPRITPIM